MKRSYIILVVAMVLCFFEVKAQSDFRDGFVLISEIDTLYGKIDNLDYYHNSQYCDFMDSVTGVVTRFLPDKIFGYRYINGKYYVSKSVEIEDLRTDLFMEYLVNGKLDIYFYQDKRGANRYFASNDTLPLKELKYSESMRNAEDKQVLYKSKYYIGLLDYLTRDCPQMKDDIHAMDEPGHKNLINIAKKYHDITCKDEKCIVYEKKTQHKIKLGVYGGAGIFYYYDNQLTDNIYPSLGVNVLFQQTLRSERFYLGLGFFSEAKIGLKENWFRVPFSLSYLNPRMGLSPLVSYEFDLDRFLCFQALKLGLTYKIKKISLVLVEDIKTYLFLKPYHSSLNFGVMYDLK